MNGSSQWESAAGADPIHQNQHLMLDGCADTCFAKGEGNPVSLLTKTLASRQLRSLIRLVEPPGPDVRGGLRHSTRTGTPGPLRVSREHAVR